MNSKLDHPKNTPSKIPNISHLYELLKPKKKLPLKKVDSKTKNISFGSNELLSKNLESRISKLLARQRPFFPFISNKFEVGTAGFYYGANTYNQNHNMIISCPMDGTVNFIDAVALKPRKQEISLPEDQGFVAHMAYSAQTEIYLFGYFHGGIYKYHVSENKIEKLLTGDERPVTGITWLNSDFYAFSVWKQKGITIGNLETIQIERFDYHSKYPGHFVNLESQELFVMGSIDGFLSVHRTNKLMKLPAICLRRGDGVGMMEKLVMNKKEYIVTSGSDGKIKIWHVNRGRIRLLKVIEFEEDITSMVYLENYRMIAVTCRENYIKFLKIPSGKLRWTLDVEMSQVSNVFLMKDKNALGVADWDQNVIKIIQLSCAAGEGGKRVFK